MAPRAIWSGAISFGMVTIPVRVHSATHSKDISFNLLHAPDGARIEQKRFCSLEEVEVPWSEVVRGYRYAKDQYVTLTDEDFESLPLPSLHTVEISAFVQESEIDPVYYERSYFLAPDKRGEKPSAMLLRALAEKELVAIASITIRKKEQLCALRPQEGTIMLATLYYPDEIELEREVDLAKVKVTDKEMELAFTLIDLLRKPFEPEEYHDHYREALSELIEAKLEGKEIVTAPPPRETPVIDIAERLARSVAAVRGGKAGARGTRTASSKGRKAAAPRSVSAPTKLRRKAADRKAG
ncbi:MAG TPA: Ku protein [Gemmatimonadales bacterium]|nr:Ku protein [Gemmatimonadales bacterium]